MKKRKKLLAKKWPVAVCVGILGIICIGVSFLLFAKSMAPAAGATPAQKIVIYPSQYSDTHITKNARLTDQKFKDSMIVSKQSFLASVASSFEIKKTDPKTSEQEKGTWLWTPTLDMTPSYWNSLISNAKENGIRNFYLSIDSYLDIFVMPEGKEKEAKKRAFNTILENFIAEAQRNNMTVDAEAGWRNWAEPGNEYKAFAIIDFVLQFNATHTKKFRGFQYDIEPYLLDTYAMNKKTVLHNFVNLVEETAARLGDSDVAFSVVIPDFYDGEGAETPRFFYGWSYGYALNHLLNVLERRPGSTILIMAYRNFSQGEDGAIDISQREIQMANNYHTKVIVAQETGEISPSYITFYNTSLLALNTQIQNIHEAFADDKSYNGIAIHYINALMELE